MRRFGVPGKLVRLLEALHSTVNVGFDVEEVRVVIDSNIGMKQGGLLGPQLFIFHICAIMQAWRVDHGREYEQCRFRTRMGGVVCSRDWETGGNCSSDRGGVLAGVVEADEQRPQGGSEYIRARVRRVEGKTVAQALQVEVLGAKGGLGSTSKLTCAMTCNMVLCGWMGSLGRAEAGVWWGDGVPGGGFGIRG